MGLGGCQLRAVSEGIRKEREVQHCTEERATGESRENRMNVRKSGLGSDS